MTAAFTEKVKGIVRERAAGKCELCGTMCVVAHFHHRRPRGMGGSRSNATGSASNCLMLHPRCHADVESSRERAIGNGWIVPSGIDPLEVPVKLWHGRFFLEADGSFSEALGNAPT